MTNADKIKNMTNEELATVLSQDGVFFPRYCGMVAEGEDPGFCDDDCYKCVLKWLNQEVVNQWLTF